MPVGSVVGCLVLGKVAHFAGLAWLNCKEAAADFFKVHSVLRPVSEGIVSSEDNICGPSS